MTLLSSEFTPEAAFKSSEAAPASVLLNPPLMTTRPPRRGPGRRRRWEEVVVGTRRRAALGALRVPATSPHPVGDSEAAREHWGWLLQ